MSKLFGGTDNGAIKEQIAQQQAETERLRQQAEAERRDMSAKMAASAAARRAGGSRALLADMRLNPETGLKETLGGGTSLG